MVEFLHFCWILGEVESPVGTYLSQAEWEAASLYQMYQFQLDQPVDASQVEDLWNNIGSLEQPRFRTQDRTSRMKNSPPGDPCTSNRRREGSPMSSEHQKRRESRHVRRDHHRSRSRLRRDPHRRSRSKDRHSRRHLRGDSRSRHRHQRESRYEDREDRSRYPRDKDRYGPEFHFATRQREVRYQDSRDVDPDFTAARIVEVERDRHDYSHYRPGRCKYRPTDPFSEPPKATDDEVVSSRKKRPRRDR